MGGRAVWGLLLLLGLGVTSLCIAVALIVRPKLDKRLWLPVLVVLVVLTAFLFIGGLRAEEAAYRVGCMSNTRLIGVAMMRYAEEHDNQYPDDFAVLLRQGYLTTLNVFVCPSRRKGIPREFWEAEPKTIAAEELQKGNCYELVPGATPAWPYDTIILHDKEGNHRGAGRNCFFNDGHVEWLSEAEFQRRMRAQEAKLREMRKKEVE